MIPTRSWSKIGEARDAATSRASDQRRTCKEVAQMANATLTQDYVRSLFNYRDGRLYWNVKRRKVALGAEAGCSRDRTGRKVVRIDYAQYLVHRIVFLWHHGEMPTEIDHVNRDPSDNRIENLRAVTHQENHWNRGASGTDYMARKKKWRARIRDKNGTDHHLGLFDTEAEARAAYLTAKESLHKFGSEA